MTSTKTQATHDNKPQQTCQCCKAWRRIVFHSRFDRSHSCNHISNRQTKRVTSRAAVDVVAENIFEHLFANWAWFGCTCSLVVDRDRQTTETTCAQTKKNHKVPWLSATGATCATPAIVLLDHRKPW